MARMEFSGLISNGQNSFIFVGQGIEPKQEKKLGLGTYTNIIKGELLSSKDTDGVMIGEGLAKLLNVEIGKYLTLLTTTASGSINGMDVKLVGIISTGMKDYDDRIIILNLSVVQYLLRINDVQRIVVVLDKTDHTTEVVKRLKVKLNNFGIDIRPWSELADYYHQVVSIFMAIYTFINIVVVVIVVLSITNTMTMSVLERTREIGTIRAIGTRRNSVVIMFVLESVIIGCLGSLLGIIFGGIISKIISSLNITMPPAPGYTIGYPLTINLPINTLLLSFILSTLAALVSGFLSASKIVRLKIVEALRFI